MRKCDEQFTNALVTNPFGGKKKKKKTLQTLDGPKYIRYSDREIYLTYKYFNINFNLRYSANSYNHSNLRFPFAAETYVKFSIHTSCFKMHFSYTKHHACQTHKY